MLIVDPPHEDLDKYICKWMNKHHVGSGSPMGPHANKKLEDKFY